MATITLEDLRERDRRSVLKMLGSSGVVAGTGFGLAAFSGSGAAATVDITATLNVTDGDGNTDTATQTIAVEESDLPEGATDPRRRSRWMRPTHRSGPAPVRRRSRGRRTPI